MNQNDLKEKIKAASIALDPIIDLLGAHAEGMAMSQDGARKAEEILRQIDGTLQDIVSALSTR